MKSRSAMVLTAIVLATMATLGIMIYVQSLRAQIKEDSTPVNVLIARKAIPKGTSIEIIEDKNLVEIERIPKRYVAEGAYSDLSQIHGHVLTITLNKGEQLTSSKLEKRSEAGLSYQLPEGLVAISIPIDEVIGVSGHIKQDDRIDIIATFSPGPGGTDISKTLLQNVQVLSVSSTNADTKSSVRIGKNSTQGNQKKTITLALSSSDAEKLVFAEEKGSIWLMLLSHNNQPVNTGGQTLESIFK